MQLAVPIVRHQIAGSIHWVSIKCTSQQNNVPIDPVGPARGIAFALPLSMVLWAGLIVALLR